MLFRSSAGDLFEPSDARRAALRRGTAEHAAYERIEWIDPAAPKNALEARILASGWREAFVRPPDAVALWRERAFELVDGGAWVSGQFDRVVFAGEGEGRRAVIYDFKTNARRRGESDEALVARLEASYAGQMAAYRRSLSSLAGIPADRVATRLLAAALLPPSAAAGFMV